MKRFSHEYSINQNGHGPKATVVQFPMTLAYASTAHKMQGRTVREGSNLVIHWQTSLQCGMAYVMLGRSEKLEDIYIVGEFDPKGIKVSKEALEETERLEQMFISEKEKEDSKYKDCFTISFLNVNRLIPHFKDIISDHMLMRSDVLSLGETWLTENETAPLEDQGFRGIYANVGNGKGLATFIRKSHDIISDSFTDDTISATLIKTESIDIISLYLSHGFNSPVLEKKLDEWIVENKSVAIMGDVNLNYNEKKNHSLLRYLDGKNFLQIVEKPTHDSGGMIDHIFINPCLQEMKAFHSQRSVYYSDHDVLVLHVPIDNVDN